MTTEAELVLMTLTSEELDDASRWIGYLDAHWKAIAADPGARSAGGLATDGPWHLMTAMRLAITREQVQRAGGEEWFAGQPTDGHPAARVLELYARRLQANVAQRFAPRLTAAGVLEQQCATCGQRKPLTAGFWPRRDGLWSDICLDCRRVTPEALQAAMELGEPPANPQDAIPLGLPMEGFVVEVPETEPTEEWSAL